MILHVKLGTLSLETYKTPLRKPPTVGMVFQLRAVVRDGSKPFRVRCMEIGDYCGEPLYFCERW